MAKIDICKKAQAEGDGHSHLASMALPSNGNLFFHAPEDQWPFGGVPYEIVADHDANNRSSSPRELAHHLCIEIDRLPIRSPSEKAVVERALRCLFSRHPSMSQWGETGRD